MNAKICCKLAINELFTLFTGGEDTWPSSRLLSCYQDGLLSELGPFLARSSAKPKPQSKARGKNRLAPPTKFMPANQGAHEMILKQTHLTESKLEHCFTKYPVTEEEFYHPSWLAQGQAIYLLSANSTFNLIGPFPKCLPSHV